MIVRLEVPQDRATIHAVHAAAFDRGADGPVAEAVLWDLLHGAGDVVAELSFVATVDGTVVGHAGCSQADIDGRTVVALGPVGVLPAHQGRGVGSALVTAVVAAAEARGEPMVVLLGDPRFYARFGFELAAPLGVQPPDPAWADVHFQLCRLSAWNPGLTGAFHYAPAFVTV
ncbi:N-acetyltransferase [Acidothermaceae bacterium B102]|nr:N-acetyltransferase [Acidothermaceae bacterium B102]